MGTTTSKSRVQKASSRLIDQSMENAHRAHLETIKLLLLGPGDSGKSTILKQIRIIHDHGFSNDELIQRAAIVFSNTIQGMATIVNAMDDLGIFLQHSYNQDHAKNIVETANSRGDMEPFSGDTIESLTALWNDAGVRRCYAQRSQYQLPDSAAYFFDNLSRISLSGYKPSTQDVLMTRVPTSGITEMTFIINDAKFRVFDVGGQRSQRRKWLHYFDICNAVIFVTSLSEYDQVLSEDFSTNRTMESLALFDEVCNNQFFRRTNFILFLNKRDLFEQKIATVSLHAFFDDFKEEQSYDACLAYIKNLFLALNQNPDRQIYVHETCAIDTNQVELVLASAIDTITRENMSQSGFL